MRPSSNLKKGIIKEIIALLIFCLVVFILASHFDFFEILIHLSENYDHLELDEIATILIFLNFALVIFLFRRWLHLHNEIKRRLEAEGESTLSKEKYKELLRKGSDLFCEHDLNGRITETNIGFKTYGWSQTDLVGASIPEMIPKKYRDQFTQYMERIKKQGYDKGISSFLTKNGEKFIIAYQNVLVYDKMGVPIRVKSASKDITEKIISEHKLKESEQRYRTLFEHAAEAIFILSVEEGEQGKILEANDAAADMHGYTIDELLTMNIAELDAPSEASKMADRMDRILKGEWLKGEILHIKKDDTIFPVEVSAGLIDIGPNKIILAIDRDITENKKVAEERESIEKQLHHTQKMEAIGTLAGGIAHDFNNILSGILGYAEISQTLVKKETILHRNLANVIKAGHRAKDLTNQILTFSRQAEQEMMIISVSSLVKEALKLMRASLPANITISPQIKNNTHIMANATHLHQVLINLCTNAGHAMAEKGGTLTIVLKEKVLSLEFVKQYPPLKEGNYVMIQVRDTGCGIDPAIIDQVFDPFFTTREKGKGTGMGLSVVHGIIQKYKGIITVESILEKGTTFNVYLPVTTQAPKPAHVTEEPLLKGDEQIMFVDDEHFQVDIGKKSLENLGYAVQTFTSSTKALKTFKEDPEAFDLILTDMNMPEMTGDELIRNIKAIRPETPVIICTGYSAKLSPKNLEKMNVQGFLMKPILIRNLSQTIRKILDASLEKPARSDQ